jgi:hypothetical protein
VVCGTGDGGLAVHDVATLAPVAHLAGLHEFATTTVALAGRSGAIVTGSADKALWLTPVAMVEGARAQAAARRRAQACLVAALLLCACLAVALLTEVGRGAVGVVQRAMGRVL